MDESRKQFEEWFKSQYPETADIHLCVTGGGSDLVKLLFLAWQASRDAIDIEVPGWDMFDTTKQIVGAIEDELRAAGIKVKE